MSAKLPFQKKAGFRPQFNRNNKFGFGDDDDDQDEQDQVSMVTGFEDNKLQELNDKPEEKPLTITPVFSENWRTKRRKLFVPTGAATQSSTQSEQTPEVLGQQNQTFGLQVQSSRSTTTTSTDDHQTSTQATADTTVEEDTVVEEERVKTLDEQAAEALMKEATQDEDEIAERMVIPADETEAFREDVKTRPDEATMEDYERVPVEQFGAALLRGLGWKEGEGIGRNRKNTPLPKPFEPAKQREALLGLGAKPEDVTNGKKKDRRSAYVYKETSLFKKVAKRNLEEREGGGGSSDTSENDSRSSSRNSSKSRHRSRSRSPGRSSSSRHSSKSRRRSRSRDRHSNSGSSSRHSSRHSSRDRDSSSRRRRRSRSRDSHRSSRR